MAADVRDMDADYSELREAARRGDVGAQTALGKRLLAGGDGIAPQPEEGASLIARAARSGGGEAAALASVLIGIGAHSTADWLRALEYLQQAAECGWGPAQQQLGLLSDDLELAQGAGIKSRPPDLWGRLRRGVDIAAWWKLPAPEEVLSGPRIKTFESFLSQKVCDWLSNCARPRLARSRVFAASGAAAIEESRTNSAFEFDLLSSDLVLLLARARIAHAAGFAPHALEHTNVLHYAPGQEFARHYDFFDPELAGHAQEIAAKGQRVATFLVYLNEDYSGAETDFPLLERHLRCRTGGALFFYNVEDSGMPDRRTLHAGLAPTAGEKWLLSQWIRGGPAAAAA